MRPTKILARNFENWYTIAERGEKTSVKVNKKEIARYERSLLKRELVREAEHLNDVHN